MGFYASRILPRLIDVAMRNADAARLRAEWIPKARGRVVEIGIGSGLNLPFYSSNVELVCGVDPSRELREMARKRAAGTSLRLEFLPQSAEEPIPVEAGSFDTAVMSWTLCSIPSTSRALEEVRRVLKPEGQLIFLEHGRAPDPKVAAWQERLTPMWRRVGGGCHLNRPIDALIREAGFRIEELRTGYLPGPRPMTYNYQGMARPMPDA